MNDYLVLIEPKLEDADGPLFVGAVAQYNRQGPFRAREIIPRKWGGIFQRRIIPVYQCKWFREESLAKRGISHLCLLTGDCGEADPFYFGQEHVNGSSLLCWFDMSTDQYHLLACEQDAQLLIGWLGEMQGVWSDVDHPWPEKETRTIN